MKVFLKKLTGNQIEKVESKKISFKRNVIFNIVSWFLPLLIGFISTPIILHRLGIKNYGLFSLVLGFISYSFTFNSGRVVTKYIAEFNSNYESEKISELISSALLINFILGFVGFASILLLTNWLVIDLFLISEDLRETAIVGFYIAALTIFLTMISQVFVAVLQGFQRFDIYSGIVTVTSFILVIGNLVLVLSGYKVQSLLVWNLLTILLSTVAFFIFSQKHQSVLKFTFNYNILRTILIYGSSVTAYQLLGSLLLLFERTLITRMFGEESLAFYIVPMTIGVYVHSLVASLTMAIFPIASEANANDNRERLLSIYKKSTKVVVSIVSCICLIIIVANKIVLKLWIGGELAEKFVEKSSDILVIHMITFGLLAVVIISWILVEGVKNASFNALQSFVWLIVGIPAMILLAPNYLSFGIALGKLIGVSIIPVTILIVEKWIFGKVLWRFWGKNLILLALVIIGSFYLERFMLDTILQTRFIFALEAGFIWICFFLALFLIGFFDSDEKKWLKNLLKF
jgi:O-antigen/teichoic acid export membrane protein